MQKVKYKLLEASKLFNDLNKFYSFSPEVKDLVESDIMSGMSKEDIKRYCSKRIPFIKMKIISECIKRDVPDEIINRLTAKTKDEDTLELIYELILEGVEVGLIEQAAPDNDRLLACLDKYKDGLKAVEKTEDVTAGGLEEANRVDAGAFEDANRVDGDVSDGVKSDPVALKTESDVEKDDSGEVKQESDEMKGVSTETKGISDDNMPKVNVVKNVESKIVELVKKKVSEDTEATKATEVTDVKSVPGTGETSDGDDTSEDKEVSGDGDKTDDREVANTKSEPESKNFAELKDKSDKESFLTPKEAGISRDEIHSLLTDLKTELVGGLVTALKEKESAKSESDKDDLSEKIKLLQEQLYRRQLEIADRQLEIVDTRRMLYDLNEKLDQTTRTMEEKIKQATDEAIKTHKSEPEDSMKASVKNEESERTVTTAKANNSLNKEDSKEVRTESISASKDIRTEIVGASNRSSSESISTSKSVRTTDVSASTDGHIDSVSISSEHDNSSKVVQFTSRTGDSSVITNVDFSRRKTSGLGVLAATLGCKKRSRKSMMKMAISGELSKEQLIHIVEAIRAGLTEEQLCNLIENKVDADKMPQIIEIAILENKMGYSA